MTENPLARAMDIAAQAFDQDDPAALNAMFLLSWTQYLEHVNQRWDDPLYPNAQQIRDADAATEAMRARLDPVLASVKSAVELLPRVEALEVRADLAKALGHKLTITPEEPDPGRDWSRVEAHLFKPSGKWMYQAWLDYTGERLAVDVPGVGPHGWHFDGSGMARRALHRATANKTSGVTFSVIPNGWRMFVLHPPQGFPLYVIGGLPDDRPDFEHLQAKLETAQTKLDEIRTLVTNAFTEAQHGADLCDGEGPLQAVLEVLDR